MVYITNIGKNPPPSKKYANKYEHILKVCNKIVIIKSYNNIL